MALLAHGDEADAERRGLIELPAMMQQHQHDEPPPAAAGEEIGELRRDGAARARQDEQGRAADDEGAGERHDDGRIAPRPRRPTRWCRRWPRPGQHGRDAAADPEVRPWWSPRPPSPGSTMAPIARSMPPVSMMMRLRRRDQGHRKPVLRKARQAAGREDAGKQHGIDDEEAGEDQEQRAEPFVAPPLDGPVEAGTLALITPPPSRWRPHRGGHDRLFARLAVRQDALRCGLSATPQRGRTDAPAPACRSSTA